MKRLIVAAVLCTTIAVPALAQADPVHDWNRIAASLPAPNPFVQARTLAITQLAVFEARSVRGPQVRRQGRNGQYGLLAEAPEPRHDQLLEEQGLLERQSDSVAGDGVAQPQHPQWRVVLIQPGADLFHAPDMTYVP